MRRLLLKALAVGSSLLLALASRRAATTTCGDRCRRSTARSRVTGLSAPIDIVRDADAIPHIFAANKLDALFGLGYVHAQDRLWQMEFQRRIGHGRLSEVFGAATLPQDRFLRTVGFGRAARSARGTRRPTWAQAAGQRLRRRRQRVHRHASRRAAAARVHAAALRARAVDRRRRRRVGEDDGVGSERELLVRAAAPRSRCARSARSGWRS